MARESHVPVTREGAVGALKLLMIVLATVIIWESASAVNAEFYSRGFTTAPPFLKGASKLLIGTETTAPFQKRITAFWHGNHQLVSMIATMIVVALLTTRYLILGRVLDYVYLESPTCDKQVYSGFVANIFLVLMHAGIIYGLVLVGRNHHASLAPLTLLLLLCFNVLWAVGLYIAARPPDKHPLRGLKYIAITSGAAFVLLLWMTWLLEDKPARSPDVRASLLMLLAAGVAFAVCLADAIVQSRVYCRRIRPMAPER